MAFVELMDGWSVNKESDSATGKREFRVDADGDIASLPDFGDDFPYDSSSIDSFVPDDLDLVKITKSYPHDDNAHYILHYEDPSTSGGTGPENNTIPKSETDSESFRCHPTLMSLGDGEKAGRTWGTASDRPIPFNVGKRIIEGEYTYTTTVTDTSTVYDDTSSLGKISDTDNKWLFSEITLEQGMDPDGTTTYRVSRTYQYHNADGHGWQHLWDANASASGGDWNVTNPLLYETVMHFPDTMPF